MVLCFPVDPRIIQEDKNEKERIWRTNQEAFGSGPQPKLEFAEYKVKMKWCAYFDNIHVFFKINFGQDARFFIIFYALVFSQLISYI